MKQVGHVSFCDSIRLRSGRDNMWESSVASYIDQWCFTTSIFLKTLYVNLHLAKLRNGHVQSSGSKAWLRWIRHPNQGYSYSSDDLFLSGVKAHRFKRLNIHGLLPNSHKKFFTKLESQERMSELTLALWASSTTCKPSVKFLYMYY